MGLWGLEQKQVDWSGFLSLWGPQLNLEVWVEVERTSG